MCENYHWIPKNRPILNMINSSKTTRYFSLKNIGISINHSPINSCSNEKYTFNENVDPLRPSQNAWKGVWRYRHRSSANCLIKRHLIRHLIRHFYKSALLSALSSALLNAFWLFKNNNSLEILTRNIHLKYFMIF